MAPVFKVLNWFRASARRYRWVVWGTMALAYIIVFFHRLAAGVVREDLAAAFGISGTAFGNLASMYFYAYMVMQIPVGMLADSLGARITVSAGIFLSGAGSLIFGLAPSIGWAYMGRFIVGIGASTVFVCMLKMLSEWYSEKEYATMSGVTTLIGNFGGLIAQTPLALMVGIFTWRMTFAGIGVLSFVITGVCLFLIRNRPTEMGFEPVSSGGPEKSVHTSDLMPALRAALRSKGIWPATALGALFSGAQLTFTGAWGVPWLVDVYGLSRNEASAIVSLVVIGAMTGGVMIGKFSDMVGARRWPLILVGSLNVAAWSVIVFWGSGMPPLVILKPTLLLMGIFSMAMVLCIAVTKETNNPRYTGVALSVLNMGFFIGIAAYPPAMGAMIDLLSSYSPAIQYRGALSLCLAGAVVGLALAFRVPETHCRNITISQGGACSHDQTPTTGPGNGHSEQ